MVAISVVFRLWVPESKEMVTKWGKIKANKPIKAFWVDTLEAIFYTAKKHGKGWTYEKTRLGTRMVVFAPLNPLLELFGDTNKVRVKEKIFKALTELMELKVFYQTKRVRGSFIPISSFKFTKDYLVVAFTEGFTSVFLKEAFSPYLELLPFLIKIKSPYARYLLRFILSHKGNTFIKLDNFFLESYVKSRLKRWLSENESLLKELGIIWDGKFIKKREV